MEIEESNSLAIYVNNDQIILKSYQPEKECLVTGKISNQNLSIFRLKINLSREGAEKLARTDE